MSSNHSRLEGCFVSGGGRAFQHAPKRCFSRDTGKMLSASLKWIPHPVIVTIRDHRDYMRVLIFLLFDYYRLGVLLRQVPSARGGPPGAFMIS